MNDYKQSAVELKKMPLDQTVQSHEKSPFKNVDPKFFVTEEDKPLDTEIQALSKSNLVMNRVTRETTEQCHNLERLLFSMENYGEICTKNAVFFKDQIVLCKTILGFSQEILKELTVDRKGLEKKGLEEVVNINGIAEQNRLFEIIKEKLPSLEHESNNEDYNELLGQLKLQYNYVRNIKHNMNANANSYSSLISSIEQDCPALKKSLDERRKSGAAHLSAIQLQKQPKPQSCCERWFPCFYKKKKNIEKKDSIRLPKTEEKYRTDALSSKPSDHVEQVLDAKIVFLETQRKIPNTNPNSAKNMRQTVL